MFYVWLLFMGFGAFCFSYILGFNLLFNIKDYFKDFYFSLKQIFSHLIHKQKPQSLEKEETFEERLARLKQK